MKNYFFLGLVCIFSLQSLSGMDECIIKKFVALRETTWPLRRELEFIKKYVSRTKPQITTEQLEKFKWHHHEVSKFLDHVLTQCDHANMDLSAHKFSHLDDYYSKAQIALDKAHKEFSDYKLVIKNVLGKDLDTKAGL